MKTQKNAFPMIRFALGLFLFFCTVSAKLTAQTPGFIYQPSTSALGRSVLDPNGDGFTSPTNAGFAGTDYGTGSELKLIPLPIIQAEPHSDLTTGSSGGHTDIVSGNPATRYSAFILYRTVNNIDYVVIRMRIGKASTSPKGYSFLLNTDGVFNTGSSGINPGYDREIVLETGNPGQISVYQHSGATTTALTTANQFPSPQYSQRSVSLTTTNGDADYFYDFFVPFSAIGIASQPVGITAVTVTSAGSGITGTISDFNGVNDALYGGNRNAIMSALITAFPPIPITSLTEDYNPDSWLSKTLAPVVNGGIVTSATSVSGTSSEANGTKIYLYKNDILLDSAVVSGNAWSKVISNPTAGDVFKAKALATGKTLSDFSNLVTVTAAAVASPCTLAAPAITTRDNGQRRLSGTAPAGSSVTIYRINSTGTITQATTDNTIGSNPITATGGAWGPVGKLGLSNTDFGNTTYIAKATLNGCISDYSTLNLADQNTGAGSTAVATTAPEVITTPIYASTSSTAVVVKNNHGSNANIRFYVNGQLRDSTNNVATLANTTFNYSGFNAGDVVSARAIGTATNSVLSGLSNTVTVLAVVQQQSAAPVITGTYLAGSNITITGTSTEPAGTTITIYKGAVLIGTVTVTSYGTWQLTGQTLSGSDILTAYAQATGKSLSAVSNSVTVQASAPTAPTLSGSYASGAASVSGGSGNTLVRIYVDGTQVGTATPSSGAWTLSGLASTELYRGAVIHATNVVSGIESPISNTATVTGVASFEIKKRIASNGNEADWSGIDTVVSGDVIQIRIKAKDGANGGGSDFTGFSQNVTLSGTTLILDGDGNTENFTSGALGASSVKTITIGGSGNNKKITVVNPADPTAFGEATVHVKEAFWKGRTVDGAVTQDLAHGHRQSGNWTHGRVPAKGAYVKFASDAIQDMVIEELDYEWDVLDFNGSNKHVVLGNRNLIVNSLANRTTNVVKTTGTGKLKIPAAKGQSVLYPVQNGVNNFVTITNNTLENDSFAVRVFPGVYTSGTGGSPSTGPRVNVTWDIDKPKAYSSGNVGFIFNWSNSSIASGGQEVIGQNNEPILDYILYHYRSTGSPGWELANGGSDTVVGGTMTYTGYTGTFSPFYIGGTVNNLPVTLISFEGACSPEGVALNWTTEAEIHNDYYTVERSANLNEWEVIKTIPGAGNSNQMLHYSATDDRPLPGISYYRLKQTDFDGQYEYKSTVAVTCTSESGFTVFPNPGSGIFNLSGVPKGSKITLLNMMGKSLWQKENGTEEALQADLRFLHAGTYIMQVRTGGTVIHRKIVVAD